ncbi:MAG: DNA-directed RNA polymerase subunit B [Nitrososphaerota archaeon]|nr:DNA-directed RNA polymerase subunit B [Nitrososphaerota archaeon]
MKVRPSPESLTHEELWAVAKAIVEEEGLIAHHFRSYEYFVREGLERLLKSMSPQEIKTKQGVAYLYFRDPEIGPPTIREVDGSERHYVTPNECRLRNLSYTAPIYVRITLKLDDQEIVKSERVQIGVLPIMVKSSVCPLSRMTDEELVAIGEDPADPGGYFIINGSERVIVAIEDLAPNKVLITSKEQDGGVQYSAAVISISYGRQSKVEVTYKPGGPVRVFFAKIHKGIPLIVMLRALGMENDKQIAEFVSPLPEVQEMLIESFREAEGIEDKKEALRFLGNRVAFGYAEEYRIERAEQMLDNNFLIHLGTSKDARFKKAVMLCDIVGKLLETAAGIRKPDDKDHYANKRLKLESQLLTELYRSALNKLIRDIRYQLERILITRQPVSLSTFIRPGIVNDVVLTAFSTGNWPGGRVGVTQILNRTNYLATVSHLRRVQSPLSRSQPHFEARDLHGTHWGRICPAETPEGANAGLVKNLALGAEVTVPLLKDDEEALREKLWKLGLVSWTSIIEKKTAARRKELRTKVYINDELIGYHPDGKKLVRELKRMRRGGEVNQSVNVLLREYEHLSEVYIYSDEGRVRRPLVVIEDSEVKLKRHMAESVAQGTLKARDLAAMGVIEYLDASEEDNAYVALSPEDVTKSHDYLEISPLMMMGVVAGIIPFSNHNQSPRNVYEASMAKQALGLPAISYPVRTDSRLHVMIYPQKALVKTKAMDLLRLDRRPIGQNFVVAVLTGYGYNIEDAVVLNRSAIERGLAVTMSYRTYEVEARQYLGGEKDRVAIPDPNVRGYRGEQYYRVLDRDGLAVPESEVTDGMVLVGVVSPPRFMEEYVRTPAREMVWRDASEAVRPSEVGIVDEIFASRNVEGNALIKPRVRALCFPEIGDKFASRHGQKGVIGMVFQQADLPYTESGIVPDLIINPHAFPSRMTVGQLIESLAGKLAALKGEPVDGSPFVGKGLEEIKRELEELGFKSTGTEVMYDGLTGRRYEVEVFIGVTFYQRLHHLVRDKIHARSRGQVQMLTRQPTEGRARGGGLKFGEMERDCLLAYGASYLLLDRLLEQSDKYTVYFCEKCGLAAYYDLKQERLVCPIHGKNPPAKPVTLSYAFYLLLNELLSMGIYPKVILEEVA